MLLIPHFTCALFVSLLSAFGCGVQVGCAGFASPMALFGPEWRILGKDLVIY
jgi:hypothetical protein